MMESYAAKREALLRRSYPTIFKFIDIINDDEAKECMSNAIDFYAVDHDPKEHDDVGFFVDCFLGDELDDVMFDWEDPETAGRVARIKNVVRAIHDEIEASE